MSGRKHKEARKQTRERREGALPAPEFQQQIGAAVISAVQACIGTRARAHCLTTTVTGALLLNYLAGRQVYYPQAGSFHVSCLRNGLGFGWDVADGGLEAGEFHAWIARLHGPAPGTGFRAVRADTLEIIDFTSRHYRLCAQESGIPWEIPDPPEVLWGWGDQLARDGYRFTPDHQTTQQIYAIKDAKDPAEDAAMFRLALGFYEGQLAPDSGAVFDILAEGFPNRPRGPGWRMAAGGGGFGAVWVRDEEGADWDTPVIHSSDLLRSA